MRVFRRPWLPMEIIVVVTIAIGAAAYAHLPKTVVLRTGTGEQVMLTFQPTVGDVLKEAKISLGPHDRVIPAQASRLTSGFTIEVRRGFPVKLLADGRERTVMTTAASVDEFIHERPAGVHVRPQDHIYPAPETRLWSRATVRVVRIETRIVERTERLRYASVAKPDNTLPRGLTRLVQPGRPGVRVRRIAITTADGVVVDRREVGTVLVAPPQARILQVGTRRQFASRGEFAGKEIIHMEATGYAPWTGKGVDDITSIGMKAGYGVVAVDPTVIPLRSILFIEGYGQAIAGDVGGAIKGHRIDLGFNTAREALRFGRRPVRVYILSTPPPRPSTPTARTR
ncbi:MAG: DUF348 domain-containing protein [Armatimonadetes bacterium]|nr:DUF348 domain-containing protein [Armatimonadota bacterium]